VGNLCGRPAAKNNNNARLKKVQNWPATVHGHGEPYLAMTRNQAGAAPMIAGRPAAGDSLAISKSDAGPAHTMIGWGRPVEAGGPPPPEWRPTEIVPIPGVVFGRSALGPPINPSAGRQAHKQRAPAGPAPSDRLTRRKGRAADEAHGEPDKRPADSPGTTRPAPQAGWLERERKSGARRRR
jgi:hypothetical protein